MRKDQEPEEPAEVAAEGGADSMRPHRASHVVETEEDVEEGALLGESTLAKLSATRRPEDAAPEPEVASPETAAPPPADAAATLPPDVPAAAPDENPPEAA
jgi:hypothetical protein